MGISTEFAVCLTTGICDRYTQQKVQMNVFKCKTADFRPRPPNSVKNPRHEPNTSNNYSLPESLSKIRLPIDFFSLCIFRTDVSVVV